MTDETTTEEPRTDPETTAATEPDPPVGESSEDKTGREAAKYRRRLRETETERDALKATVEAMQRAEAERLVAGQLAKPSALWASGAVVGDLLNDDGTVDPEKVTAAATTARDTLGLAAARPAGYVAREGTNPPPPRQGADFAGLLRDAAAGSGSRVRHG